MVSRTLIPSAMFPVGGSETDPVPRTGTPSAMTRSDKGEPQNEQMIQDYPCGDETGHYFISSPLNVYSIGRSGSVVLYVEGGCPNFTWASDNAWATFGVAETAVRYNTIESAADEGQDTIVTVTDANGLEVTISVSWNGAASCCEDPSALSIQTSESEMEPCPGEVVVFIDGGCPPFSWTIAGIGFTLDYAETNSRRNRVHSTVKGGCSLDVEDTCGQKVIGFACCAFTCLEVAGLVSCDASNNKIYIHVGISSTICDSFTSPGGMIYGLTYYGANLISFDADTNKIYKHSGVSSTITDSFLSPSDYPRGIAMAGANLVSCDIGMNRIYVHSGISSAITDSFASPGGGIESLGYDGANLISANYGDGVIYKHSGVSSTITDSFVGPSLYPSGLTFHGSHLVSCSPVDDRIYVHSGVSSVITNSFASFGSNIKGITNVT